LESENRTSGDGGTFPTPDSSRFALGRDSANHSRYVRTDGSPSGSRESVDQSFDLVHYRTILCRPERAVFGTSTLTSLFLCRAPPENGCQPVLADLSGSIPYHDVDWTVPRSLVISSEAHGSSAIARELAVQTVHIPLARGTVESLNAGVAGAIILFEAARQRELSRRTGNSC